MILTESKSHPIVNFYENYFKMTDLQRFEFINKNLMGNIYEIRGHVYDINASRLLLDVRFETLDSEGFGGNFSVSFLYDASLKNIMVDFNKTQLVACTGKLIDKNDAAGFFTFQLTGIEECKPFFDTNSGNNSSCFIATACYGDCESSEVLLLRSYRDNVLLKTRFGRIAISIYYYLSPPIARLLEQSEPLKSFVRKNILAPIIYRINKNQR